MWWRRQVSCCSNHRKTVLWSLDSQDQTPKEHKSVLVYFELRNAENVCSPVYVKESCQQGALLPHRPAGGLWTVSCRREATSSLISSYRSVFSSLKNPMDWEPLEPPLFAEEPVEPNGLLELLFPQDTSGLITTRTFSFPKEPNGLRTSRTPLFPTHC